MFCFFYYTNCIIRICTTQFVLYKLYTNCIVRIRTRCGFCTNSYKQILTIVCGFCTNSYNFYTDCIVRVHTKCDFYFFSKSVQTSRERTARAARAKPELQACSVSRERAAQAASVQRKPRGRSPSCKYHPNEFVQSHFSDG